MIEFRDRWPLEVCQRSRVGIKPPTGPMPHRKLTVRLQAAIGLSEDDRALLARVPKTLRSFSEREPILRLGERPSHCSLLVEGFAMRQKVVADNRNQILAFYVPGDLRDQHTLQLPVMDHELVSAGRSTVALICHADIWAMLDHSFRARSCTPSGTKRWLMPRYTGNGWRTSADATRSPEWRT